MKLSRNAIALLRQRYLLRNSKQKVSETPEKMFKRVAKAIAKSKKEEKEFFDAMSCLDFLPNSPALMNAGTKSGQLISCFALPVEDSIDSIFDTMKNAAKIHQAGGGTGFNFSKIRRKGALAGSGNSKASGPVSFIEVYNSATDAMKRGGRGRGANIGILNAEHPDIMEFIRLKQQKKIANFNISVGITERFMESVLKYRDFEIVDSKKKRKVKAREIFSAIVDSAWKTGDPGVVFLDEINHRNMLKLGRIESVSACGEVPLYDYESCVLGSLNLSNMVNNGMIDFDRLRKAIHAAVKFLDNAIDLTTYPLAKTCEMTKANRKIGLGVMGFAEMLIKLGISYGSEESVKAAEEIMKFIDWQSKKASAELSKEKGVFPNIKYSKYDYRIRNSTTTAIAPTGSISMIADTSSGIEPLFALKYEKKVLGGTMVCLNKAYGEFLQRYGKSLPENVMNLFRTAHEISPEQHVRVQAAFQKYCDNAVSKTVNLPKNATREDVAKVFILAYKLKCKGITIYREGSHEVGVMKRVK